MNHSGPVPLMTHMKYFTATGRSASASAAGDVMALNHPMKTPKNRRPMVEGTRSFLVRVLNHSFDVCFSRA